MSNWKRIDGYVLNYFNTDEIEEFSWYFDIDLKDAKGIQVDFDLKFKEIYWGEVDDDDIEIYTNLQQEGLGCGLNIEHTKQKGLRYGRIEDENKFYRWISYQKSKGKLQDVII